MSISLYAFLVNDDQVVEGSARSLITKFDVKKRNYYGNTSMDAEMSLLMANQTLVSTIYCLKKTRLTNKGTAGSPDI